MRQPASEDRVHRRPWWRLTLSVLGTICAVVIVTFFGVAFAVIPTEEMGAGWEYTWRVIGTFVGLGWGILLIWRMRFPRTVMAVTGVGALILPLDPIAPAIALTWVLGKSNRRSFLWALPLAALAIAVPLWRDCVADTSQALFTSPKQSGPVIHLDPLSYVIIGLALFLIAVAAGLVRQWSTRAHAAGADALKHKAAVKVLKEQLDRREERELIAREMHDTVAHQLSLVSLRAAAFEAEATDPEVTSFSRAVRESAHQGLEEMRTLIHSLRDSTDGGYVGATLELADVRVLVENARKAGVDVYSTMQFSGENPPAAIIRGTYRIVQEGLTNALRHAPGVPVTLEITAARNMGIHIRVANPYLALPYATPEDNERQVGAGAGILGMSERATALGGTLSAGVENGQWILRAWLPWEDM